MLSVVTSTQHAHNEERSCHYIIEDCGISSQAAVPETTTLWYVPDPIYALNICLYFFFLSSVFVEMLSTQHCNGTHKHLSCYASLQAIATKFRSISSRLIIPLKLKHFIVLLSQCHWLHYGFISCLDFASTDSCYLNSTHLAGQILTVVTKTTAGEDELHQLFPFLFGKDLVFG